MDSYAIYRLEDWSWVELYQRRMGDDAFREYRDAVYKKLLSLNPGSSYDIEGHVKTENVELFVKICCSFILEEHPNYSFSDNYKLIRCDEKATLDSR